VGEITTGPERSVSMAWVLVLLLLASWLVTILLMQRLVRFRKYQHEQPPAFGTPYLNILDTLDKHNYTDEGARLIPWVIASLVALGVCFFATFWLLVS
jgi:hypothetical protein